MMGKKEPYCGLTAVTAQLSKRDISARCGLPISQRQEVLCDIQNGAGLQKNEEKCEKTKAKCG